MEARTISPAQVRQPHEPRNDAAMESTATASTRRRQPPVTPIRYAEAQRFSPPAQPSYAVPASVASIMSLLLMSVVSTIMYQRLGGAMPPWVRLPFLFTIIGSTLGWTFELGLLLAGTPYQQNRNHFTNFLQRLRLLNLAPVTVTIFFFVCTMTIADAPLRMALLYFAGFAGAGLGAALLLGGAAAVPGILLGTQVAQLALVLGTPTPVGGGLVTACLASQALLQFTALLIGTATPLRSTLFHVISTVSGVMLFAAIMRTTGIDPQFAAEMSPSLPAGSLLYWGFPVACLAGLVFALTAAPATRANLRSWLSNTIWSGMYFKLISAPRFPDPRNLSEVYTGAQPATTPLLPYSEAHPLHLPESLRIPAVADRDIEKNVTVFGKLMKQALGGFKLITALDHLIPQAAVGTPLRDKPRMAIWSRGENYWPSLFGRSLFGYDMPNHGRLEQTPRPALAAFEQGQLLAYLTGFGVGNCFARPAPERGPGWLVSDFRHLEKYATKPDYAPYGGMAWFRINEQARRLELVSVVAPGSDREIAANPADPSFRCAEQQVIASLYFAVISGKHLAEIHMTLNLVEVSMHNAFDAQGQWAHPFRSFMYLHFFSHELAEEITTEHLIQEGAVFNQIFATTHEAMVEHLNDSYSRFEFGVDEDMEGRTACMTMSNGEVLPGSCIQWEREYFDLWLGYTSDLIDIIYADDAAVQADRYLQDFHSALLQVLVRGLPARYEGFQTRRGVARFAADTMHHCVVRHQVYGTTGIRAALDPRISSTQVPRDTGTPGIDEWRALAYVALATGTARFTLLCGQHGKDFTYLLKGVDSALAQPMAEVFTRLQQQLVELDRRWTATTDDLAYNYDCFRPLPSELHTGPGY